MDMFFVLSGFLISFISIKEHRKYGTTDLWNFYRSRFLRIWPTLAVFVLVETIMNPEAFFPDWLLDKLSILLFIKNFMFQVGNQSITWSVSVEF